MHRAVIKLFLALAAALEVHQVQLVLFARKLSLAILPVDGVVQLTHPDRQRLTGLHRNGAKLRVRQVALQVAPAQLAGKQLACLS